ncbi:MAG TPA: deoxyribonuclease HsdR [Marinilabiliaceae bacterium]|nr:deoxyribonuclease HsdR [Marinilabiliaceae bacterium]HBX88473.1 deoxyribonuclease HsdR [Marinilabiliaceae bacterium]
MNAKQVFTTFAIAIISAFIGVFAYSKFFKPKAERIEVPVHVEQAARYASLPAASQGALPDLTFAAENSVHAVVHVMTKGRSTASSQGYPSNPLFEFFFGPRGFYQEPQQPQPVMGAGSGVIISNDGFIVTNNHVIENANEIEVTLNDKRTFKAVKVGSDPSTDLALLKIDGSDLPYMRYGNSDVLKIGEWVLAVGNPFNLTSTVTAGIISAKSRSIQILGQMSIEAFLQTDAAVNPGNSGGALVNTRGELIGINTAIASRTGSFTGYSFAIPVSIVEKVVADLMEFGEVQRGLLGVNIREIDNALVQELKLNRANGVYVAEVIEGGGAEAAGIKAGDIITAVNGDAVNSVPQLQERVSRHRPGDNLQIEIIRDGKRKPFTVTLRNIHGNTDVVKSASRVSVLGATFEAVSDSEKQRLKIRNGLKVKSVSSGKFRDSGINEGYIITQANRVPINSEEDLNKVVEVLNEGLFLTGIYPNGRVAYYAINLQD